MFYTEICSVPFPRSDRAAEHPVPAIARRLAPAETLELRLQRFGGRLRCFLGLPTVQLTAQATLALRSAGCVCRFLKDPAEMPGAVTVSSLLQRRVEERILCRPGGTPARELLPAAVAESSSRRCAFLHALDRMPDGSGIALLLRRHEGWDAAALSVLSRMSAPEHSTVYRLLHDSTLFRGALCAFSPSREQEALLCAETAYAFDLEAVPLSSPAAVGEGLLNRVSAGLPAEQALRQVFTSCEAELLADLSLDCGYCGLPVNKDSLFGVYKPRLPASSGPMLTLGCGEDGELQQLPLSALRRHLWLSAAPGGGKGNFYFHLLQQLYSRNIPFLAIEAAKDELHHLRKACPKLDVWRPAEGSFVLNPFALPPGITLGKYRDSLMQIIRTCFRTDGPLEELYSEAMNNCFIRHGYSDSSLWGDAGTTPFGLSEFIREFRLLLSKKEYSARTGQDMSTAGLVRLQNLFNQNRALYDTVNTIPADRLTGGFNLLQLQGITTREGKQLFASLLLISLAASLRLRFSHTDEVRLVILMDESHELLRSASSSVSGEEFSFAADFNALQLELRSRGVCFVVADQSSKNLPEAISSVCATKIFLGSSPFSGICAHSAEIGADEEGLSQLFRMTAGQGLWHTAGMEHPAFLQTPNVIDRFGLDQPYPPANRYLERHPRLTLETYRECLRCPVRGKCRHEDKTAARSGSARLLLRHAQALNEALINQRKAAALPAEEQEACKKALTAALVRLLLEIKDTQSRIEARFCTLIQFIREFDRTFPCPLPADELMNNAARLWA